MAVTPATFKAQRPEFDALSDALVQLHLDQATRALDARVFGATFDDAVSLHAAELLALSPYGLQARLVAKDGSTTYGKLLERLKRAKAGGPWTVGQLPDGSLLP